MLWISFANCIGCCVPLYRAQVRRDIMQGLINNMRNILRDPSLPSRGLASGTAKKTSSKRHIPGGLLPGHGRMRSGHQSPAGSLTSLYKHPTPAILVLLAVLALGLLFLLPGGLLHAQNDGMIEYAENGMDAVATFTAEDPEDRMVYWSLAPADTDPDGDGDLETADAADAAEFSISSDGVLSFNFSPDFEMMMGGGTANDSNTYKVVVVAADEPQGAANRELGYKKVTVMVTDEDEPGMVTLSAQKPQIGEALTATLTDDDATDTQITAAEWMWEHSDSKNGPWTPILTATTMAYMPVGVVDKYLRVTATYTDRHGSDKSEMVMSANMVRAMPTANNANPVFPDEDTGTENVIEVGRKVDENSPPGTRVGNPVVANDAVGDTLTYTFGGGANDALYRINQATGQIIVGPRTALDFENITDGTHTVQVVATDPAGGATSPAQDVTITINDVNEAPMITAGNTRVTVAENADATAQTTAAPAYAAYPEVMDTACSDATCTWSLEGTDAGDFEIGNESADLGQLTFKEIPNYEMPADANGDNVYMVTVVVTDAGMNGKGKLSAERDVVVTVMNVNEPAADDAEENPVVTLSSLAPKVGVPLVATLSDPDGGEKDIEWQWSVSTAGNTGEVPGTPTATPVGDIDGAETNTYTPKINDVGAILTATVMYADAVGSGRTGTGTAPNGVVQDLAAKAPEFDPKPASRSVPENYETGDNYGTPEVTYPDVGAEVTATDPNGDIMTYSLGGTDAGSFDIGQASGQITVKTATKLNLETKPTYMVTVTATDPGGLTDSVDVTIKLTDEDEAPEITGLDSRDYPENGRGQVASFTARDPEGRPVYWSLLSTGTPGDITADDYAEQSHFRISSNGMLSFNFPPDYEAAPTTNTAAPNTYRVVVAVADEPQGAANRVLGYKAVTVNVTNVEETETVTLSARQGQVSVALTATYNDADEEKPSGTDLTWTWYLGGSEIPSGVTQDNSALTSGYTPTADGSHRVEASYTKTDGSKKSVSATISVRVVPSTPQVLPNFPSSGSDRRSVDENSAPGTRVGSPVAATDPGDTLTYTIGGTDGGDYRINQTTGQITVGPRTSLDADTNATDEVSVTATDPAGGSAEQAVTITINDVNEAPMITAGDTKVSVEENATTQVGATYTAYPEVMDTACSDATCTWSLEGTDAGDFEIGNESADLGQLTFKEIPNYEMPADANGDNVYMVTVVVTDAGMNGKGKLSAERDVVVTVMNVNEPAADDAEENPVVTLSSLAPKVGVPLVATLSDPDGGEKDIEWQWSVSTAGNTGEVPGTPTATPVGDIDGAETNTYTPKINDVGAILTATVMYADAVGSGRTGTGTAPNGVVQDLAAKAPEFDPKPASRSVPENYETGDNYGTPEVTYPDVGAEVTATDPNGDIMTYSLGGTDAGSFDIDQADGQISVKAGTKLDLEAKATYMVTVTATDPGGLSDSVDVTIKLTDEDEAPVIMRAPDANVAPEFASATTSRTVAEDTAAGEDIGNPVAANDANGDTLTYALSGTDAASFAIDPDTGQLMTKDALDYETKNSYEVMVTATDPDSASDMITVTITVTNEEEMGEVTLWDGMDPLTTPPQVGDTITGAVMDQDGGVTGETWLWAKTMTPDMMDSWMPIEDATEAAYMVMAGDEGYHLRVMATYTDAVGTDTVMEYSPATMMVTAIMEQMGAVTLWDGTDPLTTPPQVGDTITGAVMDPDGGVTGETWQWAKSMTPDMMDSWMDITDATEAAYMVTADDTGYYLRVMATYMDAVGTDTAMEYSMPTMMVEAAEGEMMGEVTLWVGADALTMAPQVGDTITGAVMDPDGGVTGETWQWSRTMTPDMMDSWMDITDATDAAYMVTAGDTGYYLRVMATYMDAVGTDTAMGYSMPTMMVEAAEEMTLLGRYDTTPQDGSIQLEEARAAVGDYFVEPKGSVLSLEDAREVVGLYFEYKNSQSQ